MWRCLPAAFPPSMAIFAHMYYVTDHYLSDMEVDIISKKKVYIRGKNGSISWLDKIIFYAVIAKRKKKSELQTGNG